MQADQSFTAEDLGLDTINPHIQVDVSERYSDDGELDPSQFSVSITVTEELDFHIELDRKFEGTVKIFDEDGTMTADAEAALIKLIKDRYDGEFVEIEDEDTVPFFRFELHLDVPTETTMEDLGVMIWDKTKLVQFHNEVDPGTFGSPYLFGTVLRDAMKD